MKGLFLFPPNWCCSHPYMSIPCLIPFTRKHDLKVIDLNIAYNDFIKSDYYLNYSYCKIQKKLQGHKEYVKYDMIYEFLKNESRQFDKIINNIDDFLQIDNYVFCGKYIEELKGFIEVANDTKSDYYRVKTIDELLQAINDNENNHYLHFYDYYFKDIDIRNQSVAIISLAGTQQLLSSMTLVAYLKKRNPYIKIVIGGNAFTKITNRINDNWKKIVGKLVDYISLYEGEYSLVEILDCIEHGFINQKITNAIYIYNDEIIVDKSDDRIVDIEHIVEPTFENYNLQAYYAPTVILPYYVTRGCYWKKCTFCDHDFGYSDCFRIKSIDKIVADIQSYVEKYNVEYIHFVDEAIPPGYLDRISDKFIELDLGLKWFTCIKASSQFTIDLCRKMKKAGCQFVSIGVESCSQDVLDIMNKGITIKDIRITLHNMKKANIWAHCFMINNFEGETNDNRWETFFEINKNKSVFTSIGMGNFTLSRNAKIAETILIDGIEEVSEFSNDLIYASESALDKEHANQLCHYYRDISFTSEFLSKIIFEREHLAIFMANIQGFTNSDFLKREYLNKVKYNKRFVLMKELEGKLYVYSLLNKNEYVLPKSLKPILDLFEGDLSEFIKNHMVQTIANKDDLVYFLLEELFA